MARGIKYIGGGWGNCINWFGDDHTRIYGFKDPYNNSMDDNSILIDLAGHANDPKVPIYLVKNVKYERDPYDMFYADAIYLGTISNEKCFTRYGRHDINTNLPGMLSEFKRINEVIKTTHRSLTLFKRMTHKPYMIPEDMLDITKYQ